MAVSRIAGSQEDLKRYMEVLSDVRRAAIIVCDSIRVRELPDSGTNRSETVVEDAPRCPICTFEYEDPTVILGTCGHGMHLECSERFTSTGARSVDPVYACPLCRAAFRKKDVVLLRGVVPGKSQAANWRTVQLTSLWNTTVPSSGTESGTASLRDQIERLYVYLRAAFRNANDLGYALGGALQRFNAAVAAQLDIRVHVEGEVARISTMESRVRKQLDERRELLDERERKLLRKESQNTGFMMQCVAAAKRDEWNQLRPVRIDHRVRMNLQRTVKGLGRTQKLLEAARRDIQVECQRHSRDVRAIQDGNNREAASSVREEAGPARDEQLENNPNLSSRAVASEELEVIGIEETSDSGDENAASGLGSHGEHAGGNTRLSTHRRAKRTRRNYRIE